jgi:hypothetical protein
MRTENKGAEYSDGIAPSLTLFNMNEFKSVFWTAASWLRSPLSVTKSLPARPSRHLYKLDNIWSLTESLLRDPAA